MKNIKKLLSFAVVFIVVMVAFCSVSFAADQQYTENLIPKLSSYNSSNGIVTPISSNDSFAAWYAFDRNINTNVSQRWFAYEFSSPKVITKYTLIANYSLSLSPRNWTFEAWDGTKWIVLDTRVNVTDWKLGVKKEFSFYNINSYKKYKIYMTESISPNSVSVISEMEMMEAIVPQLSAPTNLIAKAGDTKADLKWDAVEGATSYNIKRAETSGGPYTTIATGSAITYQDTSAKAGTTYYYVVTAVNPGGESSNSNEVSVTVTEPAKQLKLVLEVKEEKQLSVSDELSDNADMTWASSDTAIASVDANGMLKALKPGNTVITCTSADKSYIEKINVLVVDLEYKLAVDLNVGEKCRLTVDDLAGAANVSWTSYDPAIASVTAKGKVTAVSEGLTYIIASDKDGKEIGRIYIRVRK